MSRSTRRTDAAFSPDETAAFLAGQWIEVRSSNVKACRYLAEDRLLEVEFDGKGKPSSFYAYPGVDEDLAEQFALAPSKGGGIWDLFRWPGRPYTRYV